MSEEDHGDQKIAIDTIVFSGGGADGAMFIGAMKSLLQNGTDLQHAKTLVGYSIGAVMAVMVGMRMTPADIETSILRGFQCGALSKLDIANILNMPTRLGIDDGRKLMDWLGGIMADQGIDQGITFRRFQQLTGFRLVVAVSNLTHARCEFMSAQTTPDAPVLLSIRMSTAVPMLYTPVQWNGCIYVDGVLIGTPYLESRACTSCRALVLNIDYDNVSAPSTAAPLHFHTYMLMLFRSMFSRREPLASPESKHLIVNIPSLVLTDRCPINYNLLSLQIESKVELSDAMHQFVNAGYLATQSQIFSSAP